MLQGVRHGKLTELVFEISDNGCGIPQGKFDVIFEPFYTTKDIDKGCGLGLTIVDEVVKSYGGQISVGSEPAQGTTFTISIPIMNENEKRAK